jgi:hypothetical protein
LTADDAAAVPRDLHNDVRAALVFARYYCRADHLSAKAKAQA